MYGLLPPLLCKKNIDSRLALAFVMPCLYQEDLSMLYNEMLC